MSDANRKKIYNLILLGPPGSGKSTQARKLVERFGLVHVDTGTALRGIAAEHTELGRQVHELMSEQKVLVPDVIVTQVLEQAFAQVPLDRGIILDGMPRRKSQIDEVQKLFGRLGRSVDAVIFVRVGEEISVKRVATRFACALCKQPLILGQDIQASTDVCPVCGGTIGQREDDTPEGVRTRSRVFHENTEPVIERYRVLSKLCEVDGEKTMEETSEEIQKCLIPNTRFPMK